MEERKTLNEIAQMPHQIAQMPHPTRTASKAMISVVGFDGAFLIGLAGCAGLH